MTIERGYVGRPGCQTHYRAAGAGAPVLILHMTPSSSLSWEPMLRALARRGYRAVALDTPGYGLSDPSSAAPTIGEWAERLAEAAAQLGMREYFLFGHHTGATIAATIAAEWPDRVRKLALWGYTAWPPEVMARNRAAPLSSFSESGQELLDRWNAWKRMVGDRFTPEMGIRYVLEVLQAGPHWNIGHRAVAMVDHEALARRVAARTLVLCGERDVLWPYCGDCVSWFPNAEGRVIAGGGVDVFDQFPEELAAALDQFFRPVA
ncbi:MAG: alpha/beta hydrolase [Chloroflexota bacterium]|nr:alpha/beta hydrolase [Dehalococcoidia bacterium]MDW8254617.1 alpha/beta hydrolase [Chloroflexota bacterium]